MMPLATKHGCARRWSWRNEQPKQARCQWARWWHRQDKVVGEGRNSSISEDDPSAHAEVMALRDAGRKMGNYRLPEATLVVTLEPCLMCVGAAVAARVECVVFGAADPKAGCLGGAHDTMALPFLNHRFSIVSGVCAEQCGDLLRVFFQARRDRNAGVRKSVIMPPTKSGVPRELPCAGDVPGDNRKEDIH